MTIKENIKKALGLSEEEINEILNKEDEDLEIFIKREEEFNEKEENLMKESNKNLNSF